MVHTIAMTPGSYVVRRSYDRQEMLQYEHAIEAIATADLDKGVYLDDEGGKVIYKDSEGHFCIIEKGQPNTESLFYFSCSLFVLFISTPFDKKIMYDHTMKILDDDNEQCDSMYDDF